MRIVNLRAKAVGKNIFISSHCVLKFYIEIFLVCLVDPVTRADSDRSQAQKGSEALIHVSLIPLYGVFELMYSQ